MYIYHSYWQWTNSFGYIRAPIFFSVRHALRTPSDWLGGSVRGLLLLSYTHTYIVGSWGGRWWAFFSVVCCAVLLLNQVLRSAAVQGGIIVDRPPSSDRSLALSPSLARRCSPVAAAIGWTLAALVAHRPSLARPLSFDRPPPLLSSLLPRTDITTPEVCTHAYYRTSIVESQCMHRQLSSSPAIFSCLTLGCGAVSCCAVLSFEHTAAPGMMRSIRYQTCHYEHAHVRVKRTHSCFCSRRSFDCHLP